VDETSIKVKNVWMYLYRAVDSQGNTLEFLLSPTRDAQAAKRFFVKALSVSVPQAGSIEMKAIQSAVPTGLKAGRSAPRVINVDKNAAYPKAITDLKDGFLQHSPFPWRACPYSSVLGPTTRSHCSRSERGQADDHC
jgi:transposase, IS6 family